MGLSKRLSADAAGLASYDFAPLVEDRLAPPPASLSEPIHGFYTRNGQTIPFTLDMTQPIAAPSRIVREQVAMAALVLASFIGALFHLMV